MPKKPAKKNDTPKKRTPVYMSEAIQGFRDYQNAFKEFTEKRIPGLDEAIREATKGLLVEATWPPEIVEWVRAKTGFEPEKNDPLQPEITEFQYALYRLLREETGHSFEDFEGMTNPDFIRMASVMTQMEKRKTHGDSVADTTKTETKGTARATEKRDKKPEGKRGRRPYSVKVHNRDAEIYNALKSGSTYEGLMERYSMKKTDVRRSRDRHRKKVEKKRERLE